VITSILLGIVLAVLASIVHLVPRRGGPTVFHQYGTCGSLELMPLSRLRRCSRGTQDLCLLL
jgi:hypothetical protein